MNVHEFTTRETSSIIGPELSGNAVIVEGRVIPGLTCRDLGEYIDLILDRRFSITIPKAQSGQVAWLVAHALAIGAGYPSFNAEMENRPFAPKAMMLGSVP